MTFQVTVLCWLTFAAVALLLLTQIVGLVHGLFSRTPSSEVGELAAFSCHCQPGQFLKLTTGTEFCVNDSVRVLLTGVEGKVRKILITKHATTFEVRTPYGGQATQDDWFDADELEPLPEHWSDAPTGELEAFDREVCGCPAEV